MRGVHARIPRSGFRFSKLFETVGVVRNARQDIVVEQVAAGVSGAVFVVHAAARMA